MNTIKLDVERIDYSPKEAALILNVHTSFIYSLCARRKLKSEKRNGKRWILGESLKAYGAHRVRKV